MEWFRERIQKPDVTVRPPKPLLKGRDVIARGVTPGPEIGRVLRAVYERQLDGAFARLEERSWVPWPASSVEAGGKTEEKTQVQFGGFLGGIMNKFGGKPPRKAWSTPSTDATAADVALPAGFKSK